MRKILFGISLAAATLFASNQYEVGIAGGRTNVTNSPMKNYNLLNLRIGKYLPKNHILRFELEKSTKVLDDNGLSRALLNVEKDFKSKNKITPYAFLGVGYQWVKGDYDNNIVADLGLGAKYMLNENLNLFGELRGLRDFGNNDNHFSGLLGLAYEFGETSKPAPVVKPQPKDSDNDGVVDSKDKCPNTPAGVKVDTNGCPIDSDKDGVADYLDKCPNTPADVKVDVNGCPLDSDKDGVADYLDKCPNTPAGVKVDVNGCPLDSDKDGVADYLDKCPNTPKGFKVDKNGCAITYNFQINFDNNSAKIKPQYIEKIQKFAEFLKAHPEVKAEIQGYTDNKGNYNYNVALSKRRAKAVYEALIKLGVEKDRLTFVGYGPNNPVASNDTAEGRAKNRRVVAKIFY